VSVPSPSFDDLAARLKSGDPAAAEEIFRRYAHRLIGLAGKRLVGAIRQKVDAEDLVQSAFKSFFRAQEGSAVEVHDWHSLWSLLATITLRKVGYQIRHFLTDKRNVHREAPTAPAAEGSDIGIEALAREPTPLEAAMLAENVEHILDALEGKARDVIELSLQGWTPAEISAKVGLTERTVFRQVARLKQQLLAVMEASAD
jgi:RNA polymerase sigma-70 factor (ECF subfamily)